MEMVNGYEIKPYANLQYANLKDADLEDANLQGANLYNANLLGANLQDANLKSVNVKGANLQDANLKGAKLQYANFKDSDLRGAELRGAKNIPQAVYDMFPIPEGELIVYKMLMNNVICKLKIPADSKRTRATTNKFRAEYAIVLEGEGFSLFDCEFKYKVGEIVRPTKHFNEDRWHECSSGIHFFLTKEEAEDYKY